MELEENLDKSGEPVTEITSEEVVVTKEEPVEEAPVEAPKEEETPMETEAPKVEEAPKDKPKKNTGMILGMILLLILAIGGIGFGVWEMMDGNKRAEGLNNQITALKQQIDELRKQIPVDYDDALIDTDDVVSFKNPVIPSDKLKDGYSAVVSFESSLMTIGDEVGVVSINVRDGEIIDCVIGLRIISGGIYNTKKVSDCAVSGLNGKVFQVVFFGAGQMVNLNRIGFIMEDGTVKYTLPINEAIETNDFSVKGTVNIEGIVTGAVDVDLGNTDVGYGGFSATVFVLNDGSYVLFDQAMVE